MAKRNFVCIEKPVGIAVTLSLYEVNKETLQLGKVYEITLDRELVNDADHEAEIVDGMLKQAVNEHILTESALRDSHIQILE